MSAKREPIPLAERMKVMLKNQHAGYTDLIEELTPYVKANPDDKWARGQLAFSIAKVKELNRRLGEAQNRADRPTS